MKRIHIHVAVDDLDRSTGFYAALFGAEPSVTKPDYVKWQLDDPAVNLSITQRGTKRAGVDHLGIQVDDDEGLSAVHAGLRQAGIDTMDETGATCCYAKSDKHWTQDPQGVVWELFQSHGESAIYGNDHGPSGPPQLAEPEACCG
ncbi:MAG: ArsI/CadI family heavy metal resistance metalloenzyme [Pseudomonadota bacterium]